MVALLSYDCAPFVHQASTRMTQAMALSPRLKMHLNKLDMNISLGVDHYAVVTDIQACP